MTQRDQTIACTAALEGGYRGTSGPVFVHCIRGSFCSLPQQPPSDCSRNNENKHIEAATAKTNRIEPQSRVKNEVCVFWHVGPGESKPLKDRFCDGDVGCNPIQRILLA